MLWGPDNILIAFNDKNEKVYKKISSRNITQDVRILVA